MKLLIIMALLLMTNPAMAGAQSDALGKCLVDSTSVKDRNKLIVWMFSASSQHPVVKDIIQVNEAQLNKANKDFAELSMKLLTVDCKVEAQKAVKLEGMKALQSSFRVFGEAAGKELFSSPYVAKAMAGYVRYLDVIQLGLMFAK